MVRRFSQNISLRNLCRARDLGSIQQVASNPSIPTKSYISYGGHKSQASRGWHCCTTSIHLQRNRNITFALKPKKKQESIEKHGKTVFRHSFLFNPCPRWEHALGQPPVINRFTGGCWKDIACSMGHLSANTYPYWKIDKISTGSTTAYRLSGLALICFFHTSEISNVCSSNWQPRQCD